MFSLLSFISNCFLFYLATMSSDNTGMISEISQNLREDSNRRVQTNCGGMIVDNPSFQITIQA